MLDAMNIEDIKKHLNQLNEFYQFLSEKGTEASRLEKDRFLAYISNLYDATWLVFKAEKKVTRTEPRLEEKMETRETITERSKAKLFFNPSTESDTSEEQSQKVTKTSAIPKRSTSTATEPKEKAKLPEQKKSKLKTEEVKATEPVAEEPKTVVKSKEATVVTVPNFKKVVSPQLETAENIEPATFNKQYQELFIFKTATDLLQKLGEQPIANLGPAIAIGKRYQFVGQLFSGDVVNYTQALDKLNNMAHFNQARLYMEQQLIGKYSWTASKRKNLAKDFIKLVRRRYL